ncbi:MAG: imidazolonepropionase-like amidohydrolase [Cyclobacteriaceae bacterium]|jgi:imidazolonepropionase-like amidohydrolase
MPANVQRDAKLALASITDEAEGQAYRFAYDKIIETLRLMKKRGILIVPGTDMGGAFYVHRELEIYQQLGYTPAELWKLRYGQLSWTQRPGCDCTWHVG